MSRTKLDLERPVEELLEQAEKEEPREVVVAGPGIPMTLTIVTLYDRTRVLPHTLEGLMEAERDRVLPVDPQELPCWRQLFIYRPTGKQSHLHARSVVLANKRRISPDTVEAIETAENGAVIPVDPAELDAFLPIVLPIGQLRKLLKGK